MVPRSLGIGRLLRPARIGTVGERTDSPRKTAHADPVSLVRRQAGLASGCCNGGPAVKRVRAPAPHSGAA